MDYEWLVHALCIRRNACLFRLNIGIVHPYHLLQCPAVQLAATLLLGFATPLYAVEIDQPHSAVTF